MFKDFVEKLTTSNSEKDRKINKGLLIGYLILAVLIYIPIWLNLEYRYPGLNWYAFTFFFNPFGLGVYLMGILSLLITARVKSLPLIILSLLIYAQAIFVSLGALMGVYEGKDAIVFIPTIIIVILHLSVIGYRVSKYDSY